jgi:hypothetical protein
MFRKLRDQRAVGRYGGLTGSPDESGTKRREKGGQCTGAMWHDPIGLALAHVPGRQRADTVVSSAHGTR